MSKEKKMMGKNRPKTKNVLFFKGDGGVGTFDVGGRGPGVCPSFFGPPPPPINFVHDHLFFSKFIIIYFFVM